MRYSLSMLALVSSTAFSAVNGTAVNWSNYTDMVNNNCTGTVIAAKYVLTAAHCSDLKQAFRTQKDEIINPTATVDHPNHASSSTSDFDIAVLTLPKRLESNHIHYFADLNVDPLSDGEEVRLFGFAGTLDALSYATMTVEKTPAIHTASYTVEKTVNGGKTQGGDSGGAWLNINQEIVAIHNASSIPGGSTDYTYGINLHNAKEFILTSINGWHYPTSITANGTKSITVQSLHFGGVADSAYVEGDVSLVGGTCYSNSTIGEFEKCTYEINATGKGKLWLSSSEYININNSASASENEEGSSGGSFGFLTMLALVGLGSKRLHRKR